MRAPFMLYNDLTGFMEARNKDGSWAGGTRGWTEGEYYVSILGFTFLTIFFLLVVQATNGLTALM
jgi:hypothetical protein